MKSYSLFFLISGDAKFVATEYRLFKLPEKREGPKQVIYKGNIAGCENEFAFDHQTTFRVGGCWIGPFPLRN